MSLKNKNSASFKPIVPLLIKKYFPWFLRGENSTPWVQANMCLRPFALYLSPFWMSAGTSVKILVWFFCFVLFKQSYLYWYRWTAGTTHIPNLHWKSHMEQSHRDNHSDNLETKSRSSFKVARQCCFLSCRLFILSKVSAVNISLPDFP